MREIQGKSNFTGLETAIIGMAGRFPGAKDLAEFWNNLKKGIESVLFFTDEELLEAGVGKALLENPNFVKSGIRVEGKEYFDSAFFGYLPLEARIMDPQMRMFHECVWEALEDAGYDPDAFEGMVGIYAGAGFNTNWEVYTMVAGSDTSMDPFTGQQLRRGDFMASRVSYKLNLKGPAVFVQTACSTSLVAVHMACRSLLLGESHIALAGGVTLVSPLFPGYLYREGMVQSPDGHCRAFDAKAKGAVGGEGAAVVVLKRLTDAITDRDNILAVIKGSALNNDGLRKVGYTAPSVDGQAEALRMAYKMARVEPQSITYIEAHGTGTELGDPIEVEALTQVFGKSKEKYCALGSVKTNIGHLDTAAGTAGLIKVVLSLKHRQIPPSLHFKTPNPRIGFENNPFYVNTELREWKSRKYPLRAGVSSFGIGGTNAHVVLEETPLLEPSSQSREYQLLLLSAKTVSVLDRMTENFRTFLGENEENKDIKLADAAYTLQVGRQPFLHRSMIVCKDMQEAIAVLSRDGDGLLKRFTVGKERPAIVFMFSGQGSQYINMGLDLYQTEPVFHSEVNRCFEILKTITGLDMKQVLYPDEEEFEAAKEKLDQFVYTSPIKFVFDYSLAVLLMKWGVQPAAMIGHSFGEYTAACLSGVFSLEDALYLSVVRGELLEQMTEGTMLSVPLSEEELKPLLTTTADLSLAAVNAESLCVVSGTVEGVNRFEAQLNEQGHECLRLNVSRAGHSWMMEEIAEEFHRKLGPVKFNKPQIPYISGLTGTWITAEDAVDPGYWARHLRQTIRFADGLTTLMKMKETDPIFLQMGPDRGLPLFVNRHPDKQPETLVLNLVRHHKEKVSDIYHLLEQIGRMWLHGVNIDWKQFYAGEKRRRISLPSYPFEKIKYPVKADIGKLAAKLGRGRVSTDELHMYPRAQIQMDDWEWQQRQEAGVERPSLSTEYREPSTPAECALVEIWKDFFSFGKIGIDDDFYELGGDSLKGMSLCNTIHKRLHVRVPLAEFFAVSTIGELAAYIDASQKERFAALEKAEEKEYYMLSSAQKRLYFIQQMIPGSTAYNIPLVVPLKESLDREQLEQVFIQVIQRHESFRTSFGMIGEEPVQRIHKDVEFEIEYISVERRAESVGQREQDEELYAPGSTLYASFIKNFIRPFDLSKAPLLRAGLAAGIPGGTPILVVDMHHIIADASSLNIVEKEFTALTSGGQLPGLALQYKDYGEWQNSEKQKKAIKNQEDYWLKTFAGELPILHLPFDYPRPAMQSFEGGTVNFFISKEKTKLIKEMAKEFDTTLFIMLLAAYNILLSRLSGQEDIVVGVPIAGRRHTDLQDIVGMFVNTLPIRNHPSLAKRFIDFLKEVKQATTAAYENQDYHFEDLVEKLKIKRDTSRNPVFDTALNSPSMVEFNKEHPGFEPGDDQAYVHLRGTAKFDLTFTYQESGNGLFFSIEYCRKLFKPETIERFIGYFKRIISSLPENPGVVLGEIEITGEEEKNRVLYEFNRTKSDYPKNKTLHELFIEQTKRTPDHIAIVGAQGTVPLPMDRVSITYNELDQKSNQLAHHLRYRGVSPDTIVGIMVERSIEMIIGILGILKAGGAYLPIDPDFPEERIRYMLADSNAVLLLTGRELSDLCRGTACRASIYKGTACCAPTNLAYIIYTSGTTGKPKGTLTAHYNVTRVVRNTNYIDIKPQDRILQLSNYAFDGSVFDIYGALLNNAVLVMIQQSDVSAVDRLAGVIEKESITVFFVTTALFNTLVDLNIGCLGRIRKVLFGGERVSVEHCRKTLEHLGKDRIIHVYGPTEATVYATHYFIEDIAETAGTIPIGKPISNTTVYILDKNMKPVPIGVNGVVYIGGAGVACGYLNHPELTEERFVDYRSYMSYRTYFSKKLYKTGDLARWLPDGNIEFIGRIDLQVKIRGFRIEPGEIEKRLLEIEEITEAVVIPGEMENEAGERYLCAYIVAASEIDISDLRNRLSISLPDYMIPSYFMPIEKVPLTPNGKVDRKRLPVPEIVSGSDYVGPRDELEKRMVDMWSHVLRIEKEKIGVTADFFELGGHSLKATTLAAGIHQVFNTEVPLEMIFKRPTIRGLAEYISSASKAPFISIQPVEEKEYYELSSAQKRLFVIQQMETDSVGYNVPLPMVLEGELAKEYLEGIIEKLIKRNESLRTSFVMIDREPVQRVHEDVEFEIERHTPPFGHTSQEAIIRDFVRPFDLSKAPLLRVGLFQMEKQEHVLILDMHHIITDGSSLPVLSKEFMDLYAGKELGPLKIQYKDYAQWQKNQKERLKKQEAYWLNVFKQDIPILNLPTDYPRPAVQSFDGNRSGFIVDRENKERLRELAANHGATLYMVLLAIFNVLVAKLSGQGDVVIGTPTAGRRHAELEPIIGMFVNTLVLRNYPSPGKKFNDFLKEVKKQTLEAFENQEYQFEDLLEQVPVTRDVGRNPLFDVMFVLQNVENPRVEIPGLKLKPHGSEINISKFDLTLTGVEGKENLSFSLEYCTKLFKKETIERFIGYFENVLAEIVKDPGKRLADIEIISETEKNRILYDFNNTETAYPGDKTIHELFEEQTIRTPDHVAVGAQGTVPLPGDHVSISYNELNEKSHQLAHHLRSKGVEPDTIVGLMVERSIELIIGMMGILKAGGAYLPVDPGHPQDRIDYMLKDSNAALLLTAHELLDVCRGTARGAAHPAHKGAPTNLAYIIYTSGTTGRPKGTLIGHRALVNLCYWHNNYYEVTEKDNATQYANVGFDASVWEIFPYLLKGAALHIIGEDIKLDIQRLGAYYEKHHITISFLPTQLCQQFMEEAGEIPSLRCLLTGGDKLNRFVKRGYRLYNNYGPTENTVVTTSCLVEAYKENIPIGNPIDNSRVYILNKDNLQLQPPGVAGELCIGGDSLAGGYLNRPELTAEKFILAHSSWLIANRREKKDGSSEKLPMSYELSAMSCLYKTGDLARWLWDGNIEFIGRVDQQVKIRGYRIEPGEIEARLLAIEGIKEAVAIDRETKAGEKYLCGYVVSETGVEIDAKEIKKLLSGMLPAYMIPEFFVQIDKIPLTSSGKLDRKRLPQPGFTREAYVAPESEIETKLVEIWSEILGSEKEVIGIDANFFEIGGNSLNLIKMNTRIKELYGNDIPITTMFRLATIRELAAFVQKEEINFYVSDELLDKSAEVRDETLSSGRTAIGETTGDSSLTGIEIAIIGMAGRFPGAKNLNEFWDNLKNGIESVSFFTDEEFLLAGGDKALLENPNFVKSEVRLEGKEYFDSSFFGYLPAEAGIMNPQIRMFHECVWEALEDAGYDPDTYEGLIGLYAGASLDINWEVYSLMSETGMAVDSFTGQQLRRGDFIASRVSYKLNLEGPAVFIQTACSTSLVALHLACRSLLMGESHIALAGGISLSFAPLPGYPYQEGMPFSPDGHCRTFDAEAKGTVSGEGAALVVLKRLKDAIADRDNIMAVIKGSDVNNDGLHKVGYSAPSVDGQVKVIRKAHKMAQVEPQSITYIEAHGTGTELGDPIEVEALNQVFGKSKEKYCALGSVKTNIGHLDTAAGTAGFIKTVLALKHRQIPPSLHFKSPNPRIDFENSPFYVNTELREWKNNKYPLRAGVSSFGIGGTNAHVVLEETPPLEPSSQSREYQLLVFSAKTASALDRMRENSRTFFEENEDINFADAAYTLQPGRQPLLHRSMMVCKDTQEAIDILSTGGADRFMRFTVGKDQSSVVFMFSGQGSQYVNMGLGLYQTEPVFRSEVNRCFEILKTITGRDMKQVLYPDEEDFETAKEKLDQFVYTSPIKFVFDYSLAALLMKWGIRPDAMIGHSFGEYTAACLSGVFSLEDALYLSVVRGELLEQMTEGAMLSVPLSEEELKPLLTTTTDLSLAAVNTESLCVVSGPIEAVGRFETRMNDEGHECLRYNVSRAGHSWMMEEIAEEFHRKLGPVKFNKPQIPYICGLTGTWIEEKDAVEPGYWKRHLRETIRFADGLTTLLKESNPVFLQVGAGRGLTLFVNRHPGKKPGTPALNLVRHHKEKVSDIYHLLEQIGRLWLHGVNIDWKQFYTGEKRRRISLPTYPFEKIKYPVKADIGKLAAKIGRGRVSTDELHMYPRDQIQMDDWEWQQRQEAGIERPSLSTEYREPSTPAECALVEIWKDFFSFGKIGIDDDFYGLGGDSLKGMSLCNMIHKRLHVRVPLVDFFTVSTIRELAAHIDSSIKEKETFITIEKAEEKEYYAASSAQKRLYFIQQMVPGSTAYNVPLAISLKESQDKEWLGQLFKQVIQRHESFRTSFEMIGEEPVQRIHKDVEFEIEYISVEHRAESVGQREQDEELYAPGSTLYASFIKNFIRPFDLSKAPLLRAGLAAGIPGGTSILVVDMHHIIADASSLNIVEKEFKALTSGEQLPGLALQYKDYGEWQNSEKQKKAIKNQEDYWLKTFAGELPILQLPFDYPRPAMQSFEGGMVNFFISKEKTKLIKKMAKDFDTTLFIMLLAAYNILLSRLSSQEDIVVGVPIAGRRHADLQDIIGMFVNTLPIRNHPSLAKRFIDFLKEVKQATTAAYENQDYHFEDLVEKLKIKRDTSRNPVFDTVLNSPSMVEFNKEHPGFEPGDDQAYVHLPGTAKFDLTFTYQESGNGLFFSIEYCRKLFKPETIERFIGYFKRIISSLPENPGVVLGEIEITSEEEKNRLLIDFNQTKSSYPKDKTIYELFEEQVDRTPDSVAVKRAHVLHEFEKRKSQVHITYHVLNEKADQVAHLLREKGVMVDRIIGIKMERSVEMIIGILGILKADGAYLPIDPEYPPERIDYILKDSNAGVLVSEVSEVSKVSEGTEVVKISELSERLPTHPTHPTQLCYVIYTSGTTGRPKGVVVEHSQLVNFVYHMYNQYNRNVDSHDRCLGLTNIMFDVSVWEFFLPLVFGAQLVLLPEQKRADLLELTGVILRENITLVYIPPSLLKEVNEQLKKHRGSLGLNKMLVGVEPIRDEVLEAYMQLNPHMQIINGYGPTETTICASSYTYISHEPEGRIVPIGVPLSNNRIVLLDAADNVVPQGIPGEICISGDGVSRGYLNRPELTAEKFVLVSYRSNKSYRTYNSKKIYKTGDLARWLSDGNIEFIGRIDQQVKIRGYRIELGEIETQLLEIEEISEALVIPGEVENGEKYLCAYIVTAKEIDISRLRHRLSTCLPDYMIPSFFVKIGKIPLTPNGKVDRKRLPTPEIVSDSDFIGPWDEVEEKLVDIWAEVLTVQKEKIGVTADFFELGGHSLKAAVMVSRIHKELNVKIPLEEIFRTPNIRGLSGYIRKSGEEQFVSIEPAEEKEYYALSPSQKRLYILQHMQRNNLSYNMPNVVLLEGAFEKERLEKAIRELINRHENLRTSFEMIVRQPIQKVHRDVNFAVEYYERSEEEARELIDTFVKPFDLGTVPLLRVRVVKVGETRHLLMVDMHHIISDGTSMGIFIREFMALFGGKELAPLRIQYKDFSGWQNTRMGIEIIKKQEEYWLGEFEGDVPVLNLPGDYERPEVQTGEGNTIHFEIDSEETTLLKEMALEEGTTLYMVLLAIFNVLLSKECDQEDITIGVPTAGRSHADLEPLIGFFINMLALRNFPFGQNTFREFLREVKERTLKAYDNQDYQFEELVDKALKNRESGRNSLIDVVFVFQNLVILAGGIPEVTIPELTLKPYEYDIGFSPFDLILNGYEAGEKLAFFFQYRTTLFKEETMQMLIRNFKEVVSAVINNKNPRLKDIKISHDLMAVQSVSLHEEEGDFEF